MPSKLKGRSQHVVIIINSSLALTIREESNRRFALSEPTGKYTAYLNSGIRVAIKILPYVMLTPCQVMPSILVPVNCIPDVWMVAVSTKMAINGTEFFLTETDTCARISYSDMSHIYHTGVPDEFEKTVESFCPGICAGHAAGRFQRCVSIANTTNRKSIKRRGCQYWLACTGESLRERKANHL